MRIYTDGSCRNAVGGWAWWVPETKEWRHGHESPSTNQRMELYAALDAVKSHFNEPEITIVSDSKYLVNCFGEKWWVKWLESGWISSNHKGISNRDIWEPLLDVVKNHGRVHFEWIRGHSGDVDNDRVDALAVSAARDMEKELSSVTLTTSDGLLPRDSISIGSFVCVYCSEPAAYHFLVFTPRQYLAACVDHFEDMRTAMSLAGSYDEHVWSHKCNTPGSAWSLPIEDGVISWCEESPDDGIC